MTKRKITKICIPAYGTNFVLERTLPRFMRWTKASASIKSSMSKR